MVRRTSNVLRTIKFDLRDMSMSSHNVKERGTQVLTNTAELRITMNMINGEAMSSIKPIDRVKTLLKGFETKMFNRFNSSKTQLTRDAVKEGQALNEENINTKTYSMCYFDE